jgi:hypothetical protein
MENQKTEQLTEATDNTEKAPTAIDQALVESLTTEIETFKKGLETKVYALKIKDKNLLDKYIAFVEESAEWEGMQSLGIVELSSQLKDAKDEPLKDGNMFLKSLAVQALNFFVNKMKGKGLAAAQYYLDMIRPVNEAMKQIKADTDHINGLEMKLAAAENGIAMAPTEEKEETKGANE